MNSQKLKISLNQLISIVLIIISISIIAYCLNLVLGAAQTALKFDETIANTQAVSINRSNLNKAIDLIGETKTPADSLEKENFPKVPSAVPAQKTLKIVIINASGITGAAKQVSAIFEGDTSIELKNSEALLDESLLLYKNEYRNQIETWIKALRDLGWNNVKTEEKNDLEYDVSLILGGQKTN
jgi:cytoskeletal protein RodZ